VRRDEEARPGIDSPPQRRAPAVRADEDIEGSVLDAEVVEQNHRFSRLPRVDDPGAGHTADASRRCGVHERAEQATTGDTEREAARVPPVISQVRQRPSRGGLGMEGADRPRRLHHAIQEAERRQCCLARGLEQEPRTDGTWRLRLLEDRDLVTIAGEGDRRCPTTHAEPDDRDAHAVTISATCR
jgi:hypothetical protein